MQDAFFESLREEHQIPARVAFAARDHYRVVIPGAAEDQLARLRGRALREGEFPVVGDWVIVTLAPGDHGFLPIEAVLPRRGLLRRRTEDGYQVMVANVDKIGIVTSFNLDLNPRRLERGIAMAHDGGAAPFVVVNKADLLPDAERTRITADLSERLGGVPVLAAAAAQGAEGITEVATFLRPSETVTFLGMSGVGKSTLVNALVGESVLATSAIRESGARGRHTTTHRELFRASSGVWLIDAPGVRTFAPTGESFDATFADVAEIAAGCRFCDCSHGGEPGCAVAEALQGGRLDPDRWENYVKLRREQEFHENKHDKAWVAAREREWARIHANKRARYKEQGRK